MQSLKTEELEKVNGGINISGQQYNISLGRVNSLINTGMSTSEIARTIGPNAGSKELNEIKSWVENYANDPRRKM